LLSWNQIFGFPLQQLRLRVIDEEENDFFLGKCDIGDNRIFERLHIARTGSWGMILEFGTKAKQSARISWPIIA
jgi:hypothetical protein